MKPDTLREMEQPLPQVPDVPHWLENFALDAYDPAHRIGIYLHVGRWYRDPQLWRELVLVCIDGKTIYSRRNFGRLDDASLVGACCLQLSCEEPMHRWRWRYHGPALRGEVSAMLHRPPLDGVAYLLDFDFDWQATGPVVDFGHGTEPGAEASHYEQGGTLKGRLSIDGLDVAFDGRSFRDHTRGPRLLGESFKRHSWIHGSFPSGRTISSLLVETPDGSMGVNDLFAVESDGRIQRYRFRTPLLWDHWGHLTQPYVIEGIDEAGNRLTIQGEPQFYYPTTVAPPMDMFVGQSENYPGWRVFQMPTLLRWDGEETWGHTEVSLPRSRRPAD